MIHMFDASFPVDASYGRQPGGTVAVQESETRDQRYGPTGYTSTGALLKGLSKCLVNNLS